MTERMSWATTTMVLPFICSRTAGKTTAIIGNNGCGKSTLLKLLQGVYPPDSGRVWLGKSAVDEVKLAQLRRDARIRHLALTDHIGTKQGDGNAADGGVQRIGEQEVERRQPSSLISGVVNDITQASAVIHMVFSTVASVYGFVRCCVEMARFNANRSIIRYCSWPTRANTPMARGTSSSI